METEQKQSRTLTHNGVLSPVRVSSEMDDIFVKIERAWVICSDVCAGYFGCDKEYYQKLVENPETNTLSPSTLEVLAIIAYNQPITRVEIDTMRGVSSNHIIRKLVAKGLIKEAGKSKMPGRPNLYRTTSEFLDCFGLSSLNELPEINDEIQEEDETELFTSIYKENGNDFEQ